MEVLKNDLVTLGLETNVLDTVTVNEAKEAYRIMAKVTHPDKVGPEFTKAFQELGNS